MRLLDSGKEFLSLKQLGFNEEHLSILDKVCKLSQGMILVTGPTGSGKTTTLYSMLTNTTNRRKSLRWKIQWSIIWTILFKVDSAVKIFASGLESILRQDDLA